MGVEVRDQPIALSLVHWVVSWLDKKLLRVMMMLRTNLTAMIGVWN